MNKAVSEARGPHQSSLLNSSTRAGFRYEVILNICCIIFPNMYRVGPERLACRFVTQQSLVIWTLYGNAPLLPTSHKCESSLSDAQKNTMGFPVCVFVGGRFERKTGGVSACFGTGPW